DDRDDAAVLARVRVLSGATFLREVRGRRALAGLAHRLLVERRELTESTAAVREQRDQKPDDEAGDPEPAAAQRDPAAARQAAAASIGDLAGVERSVAPEPHRASLAADVCLETRARTGAPGGAPVLSRSALPDDAVQSVRLVVRTCG